MKKPCYASKSQCAELILIIATIKLHQGRNIKSTAKAPFGIHEMVLLYQRNPADRLEIFLKKYGLLLDKRATAEPKVTSPTFSEEC